MMNDELTDTIHNAEIQTESISFNYCYKLLNEPQGYIGVATYWHYNWQHNDHKVTSAGVVCFQFQMTIIPNNLE